jgi:hypothetical protein
MFVSVERPPIELPVERRISLNSGGLQLKSLLHYYNCQLPSKAELLEKISR